MALLFLARKRMFIIIFCTSQRTVATDIRSPMYLSSLPFSDLQEMNIDCTIQQFIIWIDIDLMPSCL